MPRGKAYDQPVKDNAVAVAFEHGLAHASEALNIPKSTIKTWAKEQGVDVANPQLQAKVAKATTMSVANRKQRVAETKERLVDLLAEIALLGAETQLRMLHDGRDFSLAEAVGVTTRAIHDLQLLEGNATEITGEVTAEELMHLRDELQELVEMEERGQLEAG